MEASAVIADVKQRFDGEPVFLAGSLVAEQTYGKVGTFSDVDVFCPTSHVLVAMTQKMKDQGFIFGARFDRVWYRWLRYGFKSWHTNSMKMNNITINKGDDDGVFITDEQMPDDLVIPVVQPSGYEVNLIYKLTEGHPATSLAGVLESFDFGLLATGYDLETGIYRDMRSYLFPGMDPDGPLPLMPNKRDNWRQGFISQYNGLRELGRYAKYYQRGYDMSLVKDDLCSGYFEASAYLSTHWDPNKQMLGNIYEVSGLHVEADNIVQLEQASKEINYSDSLDQIMAALE